MTLKRAYPQRPWGQFLSDDGDAVMLEFYNNPKAAVPDYRKIDPLALHVAFRVKDIAAERAKLLAAGATAEGDIDLRQRRQAGDASRSLGTRGSARDASRRHDP